jgi:hypothetical protein
MSANLTSSVPVMTWRPGTVGGVSASEGIERPRVPWRPRCPIPLTSTAKFDLRPLLTERHSSGPVPIVTRQSRERLPSRGHGQSYRTLQAYLGLHRRSPPRVFAVHRADVDGGTASRRGQPDACVGPSLAVASSPTSYHRLKLVGSPQGAGWTPSMGSWPRRLLTSAQRWA